MFIFRQLYLEDQLSVNLEGKREKLCHYNVYNRLCRNRIDSLLRINTNFTVASFYFSQLYLVGIGQKSSFLLCLSIVRLSYFLSLLKVQSSFWNIMKSRVLIHVEMPYCLRSHNTA